MSESLRLICIDADAMPLFGKSRDGVREGYEPVAAALVAETVGATRSGAARGSPGSTNMALAETFTGAELVPFSGGSDDVFGDMIDALRAGAVDGIVDDDVAFVPLADKRDFEIAFTVPTRNQWGVAVARWLPELRYPCGGRQ